MTTNECALACLVMVLSLHGRHVSLGDCRAQVGVGRDGVTARTLVTAARSFGFRVRAFAGEPAVVAELALPAIAHWESAHFVVIERVCPERVEIVDPALGRRRLTPEEFAADLGGLVLTLEPGPNFVRNHPPRGRGAHRSASSLRRFFPRSRIMLGQALLASLLLQLLGLAVPIVTAVLISDVLGPRGAGLLPMLAVAIALLTLTHFLTAHARAMALIRLQASVDGEVMNGLFRHLLSLPFSFFQQRASGDLLQRLAGSVVVRELVTTQALGAVLDGVFMLGYLVVLLAADLVLGALVAALGLLQIALFLATRARSRDLHQRHLLAQSKSQSLLFEALSGIATVKATGSEDRLFTAWSDRFAAEVAIDAQRDRLDAYVENMASSLRVLAPLALLWTGAHRVLDGSLELGTMLGLQMLALAFLTPLGGLLASAQRLQSVRAYLERLRDVLDAEPEQKVAARSATPRLRGHVELRDVGFRYDPNSRLVLREISVTLEPGQKVALVGPSGSGKSTLAMLLLGLYEPSEGEILYDGVPLADLDRHALRGQFGVVLQEPFIFGDSIRRNIAANEPDLPIDQVMRAARVAALHADVSRMPMGYETRLADGGGGLSGGQRQRLAIARAVARDPVLLLLDEATSHLDVPTELRVDANLDALSCTRIVIAHRVSTMQNADQILVVDDGRIVERGRHAELLGRSDAYAALLGARASGDTAPPLAAVG
jgi:ABC-type bacteriocin/lantibiotic exporter with double-glycine peptidase domain